MVVGYVSIDASLFVVVWASLYGHYKYLLQPQILMDLMLPPNNQSFHQLCYPSSVQWGEDRCKAFLTTVRHASLLG